MVGRSAGVVIMAPPDDSAEAQAALATLLSSLKPKQKARSCSLSGQACSSAACLGWCTVALRRRPCCPLLSLLDEAEGAHVTIVRLGSLRGYERRQREVWPVCFL